MFIFHLISLIWLELSQLNISNEYDIICISSSPCKWKLFFQSNCSRWINTGPGVRRAGL